MCTYAETYSSKCFHYKSHIDSFDVFLSGLDKIRTFIHKVGRSTWTTNIRAEIIEMKKTIGRIGDAEDVSRSSNLTELNIIKKKRTLT